MASGFDIPKREAEKDEHLRKWWDQQAQSGVVQILPASDVKRAQNAKDLKNGDDVLIAANGDGMVEFMKIMSF